LTARGNAEVVGKTWGQKELALPSLTESSYDHGDPNKCESGNQSASYPGNKIEGQEVAQFDARQSEDAEWKNISPPAEIEWNRVPKIPRGHE
jgi:hypothetical protein